MLFWPQNTFVIEFCSIATATIPRQRQCLTTHVLDCALPSQSNTVAFMLLTIVASWKNVTHFDARLITMVPWPFRVKGPPSTDVGGFSNFNKSAQYVPQFKPVKD